MIVVKFGGTSLAGTDRMRAAARIVAAHRRDEEVVCVVSAMAGVTDALLSLARTTRAGSTSRAQSLTALRARHETMLPGLATPATVAETTHTLATMWRQLERDLEALDGMRIDVTPHHAHAVAAFSGWGERLSAVLFASALRCEGMAASANTREPVILATEDAHAVLGPAVHEAQSLSALRHAVERSVALTRESLMTAATHIATTGETLVLPGYLARTSGGMVTTVGRNGSDLSAAIIAAALGARDLYIYSDVHGVHQADPRAVPKARLLPALTYADAAEIASLGARVLHPAALVPLSLAQIPLHLRSSFDPYARGTDIGSSWFVRGTLRLSSEGRRDWVVVARPVPADATLPDVNASHPPDLVEIQGVMLTHESSFTDASLNANSEQEPDGIPAMGAGNHSGPVAAALALLRRSPSPVGLALSPRRVTVIVPASEAVATQRRLYAALSRANIPSVAARRHERARPAGQIWRQVP